jgi:hypothetical protein
MKRLVLALGVAAGLSAAAISDAAAVDDLSVRQQRVEKRAPAATAPDAPRITNVRPPGSAPLSAVQQRLRQDANLARMLSSRLPVGFDLMSAAAGFPTLKGFVAALNASNNLDIPFATLRTRVVDRRMSLAVAIKALRPSANWRREAARAEREASALIGSAGASSRPKTARPRPRGGS